MTSEPTLGRSPTLTRALATARAAHAGQSRYDGRPYLEHPVRVADLLDRQGLAEPVVAAALLHDSVEDSPLTVGQIVEQFGPEIGEIVAALTEDPEIDDWAKRKDALRRQVIAAGADATAVYAADKLEKIRETREMYEQYGERAINLHKAPTLDLRVDAWRADLEAARGAGAPAGLLEPFGDELARFEAERQRAPHPA